MLSSEKNEILTRVGPGTPMGNLLRRYWTPALLSSEVAEPDGPPARVRLLGEDLVAFRDSNGKVGLVAERCPHRGASLYYGRVEDCAIRCVYHGWAFDADGQCVDTPSEPGNSKLHTKVRARSYPTHESGGIVWTYMGPPETMTPFRDFGTESLAPEDVVATKTTSYCNWLQALEGDLDSAHISWLHSFQDVDSIPDDGTNDRPGYPQRTVTWKWWLHDRAPRIEVDDTWYGFKYAGIRKTPNGHDYVRISAYCFPWAVCIATTPFGTRLVMKVPSDDHTCQRFGMRTRVDWNPDKIGGDQDVFSVSPYTARPHTDRNKVIERRFTAENEYGIDRELQRTVSFTGISDFSSQDMMVTESMGPIFDRSNERLGQSDRAVIRLRQVLLEAVEAVERGEDPPAVSPDMDYRTIRSAEKVLEEGEDWRVLGTDDDPIVQELELKAPVRRSA